MKTRVAKSASITMLSLVACLALAKATAVAGRPATSASGAEVAGISAGWNNHDAHAMCASLADDVLWVNWRGEPQQSRREVEDLHAMLFAGIYANTHRTDVVKSIRTLAPGVVSVDDYWSMTGAKTRDGADWPYREGYVNYLMAKRKAGWVVIVSHTADFNAKAPGTHEK